MNIRAPRILTGIAFDECVAILVRSTRCPQALAFHKLSVQSFNGTPSVIRIHEGNIGADNCRLMGLSSRNRPQDNTFDAAILTTPLSTRQDLLTREALGEICNVHQVALQDPNPRQLHTLASLLRSALERVRIVHCDYQLVLLFSPLLALFLSLQRRPSSSWLAVDHCMDCCSPCHPCLVVSSAQPRPLVLLLLLRWHCCKAVPCSWGSSCEYCPQAGSSQARC